MTDARAEAEGRPALSGVDIGHLADRGPPPGPVAPRADTLFAPRGACRARPDGPLIVTGSGTSRALVWRTAP